MELFSERILSDNKRIIIVTGNLSGWWEGMNCLLGSLVSSLVLPLGLQGSLFTGQSS